MKNIFLTLLLISNISFAKSVQFHKKNISVGKVKIEAEIAETPEQHEQGLMFRTTLKKNSGMLFVFPNSEIRSFWMKNTFIPLTIAYFDENKKLLEMIDMQPMKSEMIQDPKIYPSTLPAKFALEMSIGWFRKNNIKVGDQLNIP